jgi:pimeloyl-ACP methyl ester carboxylesterase
MSSELDAESAPRRWFTLPDGTRLAYLDVGTGRPIVLLHGWSSSLNWFREQIPALSDRFRILALDFRGHGDSEKTASGHTMEQYARDVRDFVAGVGATDGVMVGWSMGSLVLWNYVLQFGRDQARAMVFVGQSASDLRTPAYEDGIVTPEEFHQMMLRLQTDRPALLVEWMRAMRMEATDEQVAWMVREYERCPAHIATVAFYTQTMVNSLPAFPLIDFPTRVFFGTDPKMYHISQGEYLARVIPGTRLVVFDRSGHVPMLEEPEKFNQELSAFAEEVFRE